MACEYSPNPVRFFLFVSVYSGVSPASCADRFLTWHTDKEKPQTAPATHADKVLSALPDVVCGYIVTLLYKAVYVLRLNKVFYSLIMSTDRLRNLSKAAPFNMPFCKRARSMS